ncbi:MAG: xanthine dehydrogenase family protein subunit M [Deltaproteobacteria bacterium]
MQEFDYAAPRSVDEAVELLAKAGTSGRVFAGGTDLLVQMKNGPTEIRHLIDVKRIEELGVLAVEADGGLRIGAAVPCALLGEDAAVAARFPGLREAAMLIGSDQIQSRATIAGNLCNASPAADVVPALVALGAKCRIAGPAGSRSVPVVEFTTGPGSNILVAGELLVSLHIPPSPPGAADAYQRFIPRAEMDIAVVGVAAQIVLDRDGRCTAARIALGAVGPRVIAAQAASDALVGTMLDEAALQGAAELAREAASPISDRRAPADYRRSLVGTLTRRVAGLAATRARAA